LDLIRGIQENVRRGLIDFFAKDFQIPGLEYQRPEDQSDDELPRLELIAEPGRFFVQSSHTLLVNIIGKKVKYVTPGSLSTAPTTTCNNPEPGAANTEIASAYNPDDAVCTTRKSKYKTEEREKVYNYYLNDGIYGSFNCLVFDHAKAEVLPYNERDGARYKSVIFGPTCDSVDKISANVELPELEIGEWCFVKNFGAYTVAAASDFNGFTKLKAFYVLC
jgi:ornithine decarboxylase